MSIKKTNLKETPSQAQEPTCADETKGVSRQ